MMKIKRRLLSVPLCFVWNMVLVYIVYEVCRLVFLAVNWGMFSETISWKSWGEMLHGGWYFDTSAILYTNALYALLMLLPLHYKESTVYQKIAKWIFLMVNGICVVANLIDCVYFQYTTRRTTATVFSEFKNENNMANIFGVEFLRHWYLVLTGVLLIAALWYFYAQPKEGKPRQVDSPFHLKPMLTYYGAHLLCLAVFVPLCIGGMRGGFTTAVRPITISNANQYVERPLETAIVLNTPFSLIRTMGKKVFDVPTYYTEKELNEIYSPVHTPKEGAKVRRKNVVVIIIESFGREYIGGYNKWLEDGKYKGYTPFVDSLMQHSATYLYSFCNGRKSIDGMPSVLSSIPMFVEPFFLTTSSLNDISGLAGELDKKGYHTAFFHGAENGSMGFQAFARSSGFQEYYGRTEFDADKRFRGDKDFDGTWAIWDEPFLQFYATKMSEFKQPFMTALFTASSHHPFVVPEEYKKVFPEEGLPIHKCIRYTDNALRQFFNKAKLQPWYKNTVFVLTSDHTNQSDHEYYQTDLGGFCSPIIFFDPSGEIESGMRDAIAQQIDIMPTLLDYLGYDSPYVSFGIDLFSTPAEDTWAVGYLNGIYQYVKGDYLLQFDGQKVKALYRFRSDLLLKDNVASKEPKVGAEMERQVKAIIQSYMERMTKNELVCNKKKKK